MTEGSGGLLQAAEPLPYPVPDFHPREPHRSAHLVPQVARLHLQVSPACNIDCAFCGHAFDQPDHRAKDTAVRLLDPAQAVELVERVRARSPALTVIGIAGPGEPLATHHALDTAARVHERWPDLAICLSTNGLLLPELADRIAAAGVTTLTVTVNAVDPAIQARITRTIVRDHRRLHGYAAAARLIDNQMEGIARAATHGIAIKVNTVLIPTVNEDHISDIAERVAQAGADVINIIPLLPQHRFAHLPAPGLMKRYVARADAERHLRVSNHCQQCFAGACGAAPGGDTNASLCDVDLRTEPTYSHG
ncbi:radical SAM protein [Rubrivivax sp. JA1024]|nr:radical SAM protein [Rubrivivax sp. JA1024]